jgi:hypothetical protein
MRLPALPLLLALALSACSDSTSAGGGTTQGGSEFVLTVGQTIWVDSLLRLTVTGVPTDSRCPSRVICVWAGDGSVAIAYSLGMGAACPDTLHTTLLPHTARFGGYAITLLDLMPYPESPGTIPPDGYAVRLRVGRRS